MKITASALKTLFTLFCGFIGALFGFFAGIEGAVTGIVSGCIVGFLYVHFTLNIKESSKLIRIFLGTFYGILGGLISGASVHMPAYFMGVMGDGDSIFFGAAIGGIVGAVLGLIGSIIMAFIPREDEIK